MSKDMFFAAYVKSGEGEKGMSVRIQPEAESSPGIRVKALTRAARKLPLETNEKLRTDMLVNPPAAFKTMDLAEYMWADDTLNEDRYIRHLKSYVNGKKPHLFLPRVGVTVVLEEDLIGRRDVLTALHYNISRKKSSHLRAPRRYGKSSLMGRLEMEYANSVLMELSDVGNLEGFLKRLVDRCLRREKAAACLLGLPEYQSFPNASQTRSNIQAFNRAFGELMKSHRGTGAALRLLKSAMAALADSGVILLIDEFSFFLREMREHDENTLKGFLELFHGLRTRNGGPLTAIFAGSSGLSTFIQLFGMHDAFKDLAPVDIPPISSLEAGFLAEELFYGMSKTPSQAAVKRLTALTGGNETVPYFVHALAHYTTEQAGVNKKISEEHVEAAYYDRLLGPSGNICFRDFILREKGYPGDYRASASRILKELSRIAPGALPEEDLQGLCQGECDFNKLITCLEEDYDLVREKNGWRMRSTVIADRWRLGEPWLTIGEKS